MRSLINRSQACYDSGADTRESKRDRRAFEYVQELKKRCPAHRWNLVEINGHRRAKPEKQDSN